MLAIAAHTPIQSVCSVPVRVPDYYSTFLPGKAACKGLFVFPLMGFLTKPPRMAFLVSVPNWEAMQQMRVQVTVVREEAYIGDTLHPSASLVVVVGPNWGHAPYVRVADCGKIGHAAGAVIALELLRNAIHLWHLSAEGGLLVMLTNCVAGFMAGVLSAHWPWWR